MAVDAVGQDHVEQAQQAGEHILKDLAAAVTAPEMRPQERDFLRIIEEVKDMNAAEMRKHVDAFLAQHQELERKAGIAA